MSIVPPAKPGRWALEAGQPEPVVGSLLGDLDRFAAGASQFDDITVALLRRKPA